jgi:two-component system, chemotaxis family, protein-glutamate methylesterase/glutaminase
VDPHVAARRGLTRAAGVGASAGGVDALIRIVRALPADLPAAVCIVLHVPATGRSLLAPILGRQTELEVAVPADGEPLRPGRVYVAPPDRHLSVAAGRLELGRGPKENGVRPAVDPMLKSLAAAYGEHSVAVILSGALGDGSTGALAVKQAGGTVIVQDPEDATVPSMPESAIRTVGEVDAVLKAAEIGPALGRLLAGGSEIREELVMTAGEARLEAGPERPPGAPSTFTCPECHGSLWEVSESGLTRYRCRVGHAYSEDSMIVEQGSSVETALWSALEALEERAEFLGRLAVRHGGERRGRLHDRFAGAADDARERAELIRRALGIRGEAPHAFDMQSTEAAE